MIRIVDAKDTQGRPCAAIVLGEGDMFLTVEGDPKPAVALQPTEAREVARRLLDLADRIERGEFG